MKRLVAIVPIVLLLALALPVSAFAAGPLDGRVILGDNYTLESGRTLDGDLVVLGGNVTLEEGSIVDGSVFVMGGNVVAYGEINGDVGVMGGQVSLKDQAVVHGDVSAIGGNIHRDPEALIEGEVLPSVGLQVPFELDFPQRITAFPEILSFRFSPLFQFGTFLLRSLLMAALAVLAVMFWPDPSTRVAEAAVSQPVAAGGLGLLTIVVVPLLLIMLLITIILSPVGFLGGVVLVAAVVFGWIVLGLEVGRRLATSMKWQLQEPAAAGLGTLLLTLVVGGVGWIPCVGWIAGLLVASLGLGAVILTRFGSRSYQPAVAQVGPPVEPEPPAEKPKPKRKTRKVAKKE